ncbi:hypothetical protein K8T06_06135, partial [bacterium]|nr:hypothetical protein [bacterium]
MKKQTLIKTRTLMITSLMIISCIFVTLADDSQWTTTNLRQGRTFGITAGGLCNDSQGRLHLAYGESDFYYAQFDGSTWNTESVDNTSAVGRGASIQVDTTGTPWICYTDHLTMTLKLARKYSRGWEISIIDSEISQFVTPILKLDTDNKPHVGYVRAGSPEKLVYATKPGTEWQYHQFEEFNLDSQVYIHCHLVLNIRQEPYIQCNRKGYYLLNNEWKSYPLLNASAITTDQNGSLHWLQVDRFADYRYLDLISSEPNYTRFDSAYSQSGVKQDCALLLDDRNQPHAFYLGLEGTVKHATRIGLSWHTEVIHTMPMGTGSAVSTVRVGDTFHCVVFDKHNGTMLHLENSTGQWNSTIID